MSKTSAERMREFRKRRSKDRALFMKREPGTVCGICGRVLFDNDEVEIDHRWPRAYGGSDAPENLQLAHKICNREKRDGVRSNPFRIVDVARGGVELIQRSLDLPPADAVRVAKALCDEVLSILSDMEYKIVVTESERNVTEQAASVTVTDDRHVTPDGSVTSPTAPQAPPARAPAPARQISSLSLSSPVLPNKSKSHQAPLADCDGARVTPVRNVTKQAPQQATTVTDPVTPEQTAKWNAERDRQLAALRSLESGEKLTPEEEPSGARPVTRAARHANGVGGLKRLGGDERSGEGA